MAGMSATQINKATHIDSNAATRLDRSYIDLAQQPATHQHQLPWLHMAVDPPQHLLIHQRVMGIGAERRTPMGILTRQRHEVYPYAPQHRRQSCANHGPHLIEGRTAEGPVQQQLQMQMPAS